MLRYSLPFVLAFAYGDSYAVTTQESAQLNLIQHQLDNIDHIATRAEAANAAERNGRYRFDYPRLVQDILRIHQGVQDYLSPSRAQPHDPGELVGDYRINTPTAEPSP